MKVDNAENVKHSIETVHMDMMMSIAAHPWHRYTHRQTVHNNSTILLVFKGIFFGMELVDNREDLLRILKEDVTSQYLFGKAKRARGR